jgi:hypothetical protein
VSRTRWARRHAHPDDVRFQRVVALGGDLKVAQETGAWTHLTASLLQRMPHLFDNSKIRAKLEKKPRGPNGRLSRTQMARLGMRLP